eukprot:jgi/Bigna1/73949/fgenesh1_pg.27_\
MASTLFPHGGFSSSSSSFSSCCQDKNQEALKHFTIAKELFEGLDDPDGWGGVRDGESDGESAEHTIATCMLERDVFLICAKDSKNADADVVSKMDLLGRVLGQQG